MLRMTDFQQGRAGRAALHAFIVAVMLVQVTDAALMGQAAGQAAGQSQVIPRILIDGLLLVVSLAAGIALCVQGGEYPPM